MVSLAKIQTQGLIVTTIVVDNGSKNQDLKKIKQSKFKFKLIENKQNLGFSQGNNVGIQYALSEKADYVLLLNNDTLVRPNFLTNLVKSSQKNKADIASPKIYFASGFEFHKKRYKKSQQGKVIWYAGGQMDWLNILASHRGVDEVDQGQYDQGGATDFATGCCMLINKKVFSQIGFLDPKYFLYWEDNDFCQRAKQKSFKVFYLPQSIIWHKNAGSSAVGSQLHDYYLTRNRLLFGFRYASLKSKMALLKQSVTQFFFGRQAEKKAVLDFYLNKLGKGKF